jgi:hypothetical protein
MRKTQLEITDPEQWLRQLAGESGGYSRLVSESRGLARAAYRLARACCSVSSGELPRLEDLQEATAFLALRLGGRDVLPIQSLLPGSVPPASVEPSGSAVARSLPQPPPSAHRQSKSGPHASRVSP